MIIQRCAWCTKDTEYIAYHDNEWGRPCYDKQKLFEMLILETFQAGLSWITVLKKRPRFRAVLFNFDPQQLAVMTDAYIEQLMRDKGIIRNRLKLESTRKNAKVWLSLEDPVDYLWSFVNHKPQINSFSDSLSVPASTETSDKMSKSLKKLGFTFVGSTICYAYMQAVGMVIDHTTDCFLYKNEAITQENI